MQFGPIDEYCVGAMVAMMSRTVTGLDDSLSLHGAFSTAVSGRFAFDRVQQLAGYT